MITIHNYFDQINTWLPTLPATLRKGHDFVAEATDNGTDWETYQTGDEDIKRIIDTYLLKLNQFIQSKSSSTNQKNTTAPGHTSPKQTKKAKRPETTPEEPDQEGTPIEMVERIPEEIRFIRRYLNMDGKTKTKEELLRFINSLQKAILEKKIRKTSPYAEQILFIQRKTIEVYNKMRASVKIRLSMETFEDMLLASEGLQVLPSVLYIKRYINLAGKAGMKKKAEVLLSAINNAMEKEKITDNDPYISEIHDLKKNLFSFISKKKAAVLEIEKTTLNGLAEIAGCGCPALSGCDSKPTIMNSMDFVKMQFNSVGFKGKWREFIGDPSPNFTAMVFGKPKMGKSYLCIEFAGYLARNHGKVLYIANEEGLDFTLQEKLRDTRIAHPNLTVSAILPRQLNQYDFIFLDSVTRLGLNPEDLRTMKKQYPSQSFIFVFQTTKDGNFRGANSFQHDVDVVIEVPQKGVAAQNGRFNQGGEMNIFETPIAA